MISEASCDTEDWSNDAENLFCITGMNFNKEKSVSSISYYCIFDQINEAVVSLRDIKETNP